MSAQTAQQVASMLEEVVEKGSGHSARLPGYRVAGKSGTAQKVDSGQAGYSETDYIASFVGFAPVSDPTLVVLVALDSPRGSRRQGGEVAAPVFASILAAGLQYLRVPKDAEPPLLAGMAPLREDSATTRGPVTPGQVPDVREMTLREAIATLSAQGYRARVDGSGKVYAQNPQPGALLAPGGVCDLTAETKKSASRRKGKPAGTSG